MKIRARILAIDDTPANLITLGAALAGEFDLQVATSGEQGLSLAAVNAPDLILLDVMMPGTDGFEICRQLKALPSLQRVPVIFVTALSDLDSEIRGLALGAADYLTKPINVEIARQRIRNLLEREELRREVESQRDLLLNTIAELKAAEQKLSLAASVFTCAREGIMITEADGTIIEVNEAFTRITSFQREDVLGQNPRILSSGRQSKTYYAGMWRDLVDKGHWYGEIWNRRKTGEVYAEMLTISAIRDPEGRILQYVALFSDITPLKEHEKQLEHIAHYDVLTNLPNRVLLSDRLHQAMAHADRRGQQMAVAYIDLDGFKAINDTYGHEMGDQLLINVASRMRKVLREVDTLARIGGDEFVAILFDSDEANNRVPMLTRLLLAAAEPIVIDEQTLHVSASIGVTFYPQPEIVDADQLLRQADQAMYQAKLAGKNRYHVFDAEKDRSIRGHHESLERIRCALEANEFVLYYQPKVNMRTGALIGAEALIRWQHPERGLLPPGEFLPIIEDHPLAVDVGEWVIKQALRQIEAWQAGGLDVVVSVNVGARQLQLTNFADRLQALFAPHPTVKPCHLELEVLETSALEDLAGVSEVIKNSRRIGVNFSLDDFGTGYSSLTYLKRLAVSQLKIDQSFVRNMLQDADDLAILDGVLRLAKAMRKEVIAEGVETIEQGEMLLQMGCDRAQGYGIARPMPAADFPHWVAGWLPDERWAKAYSEDLGRLPKLFASVEYKAWLYAIEAVVNDGRDVDLSECLDRINAWFEQSGIAHDPDVIALHQQIQGRVTQILALCGEKRIPEARLALQEVTDGVNQLLALLA